TTGGGPVISGIDEPFGPHRRPGGRAARRRPGGRSGLVGPTVALVVELLGGEAALSAPVGLLPCGAGRGGAVGRCNQREITVAHVAHRLPRRLHETQTGGHHHRPGGRAARRQPGPGRSSQLEEAGAGSRTGSPRRARSYFRITRTRAATRAVPVR